MMCKLNKAINALMQSPGARFDKFSRIAIYIGLLMCYSDHSIFIHSGSSRSVVLTIYIDDIFLIGTNVDGNEKTKAKEQFVTNKGDKPRYFLVIENAHGKHGAVLTQ